MADTPYQTPYERIGGEAGVRELVRVFYDLVEAEPEGAPLRAMHAQGKGLDHAREAQFLFLSGFLGGPQLYAERFHHANVRQMHGHLAIGDAEAASWLACMEKALERTAAGETRQLLMQAFTRVVNALQRQPAADDPLRVVSR